MTAQVSVLAGSPFDKDAYAARLAVLLNVSVSDVSVTISARRVLQDHFRRRASSTLRVTAQIITSTAAMADAVNDQLITQTPASLSAALGVTVDSVDPINRTMITIWPPPPLTPPPSPAPPPPTPPNLQIHPEVVLRDVRTILTITGTHDIIDGSQLAFLPAGDGSCVGAAHGSHNSGLVRNQTVMVLLAAPGVYKLCAAARRTHLDSEFRLIAGVMLAVVAQSLPPPPPLPPAPPSPPPMPQQLILQTLQRPSPGVPPSPAVLAPLIDDGAAGLSVSTLTPSTESALDCSIPPEKRFSRHETWQLEVVLEGQPTALISSQFQHSIAELADIRCDSDVHLIWLSNTHVEVLIHGLRPGRPPAYLQATKRSRRLELVFHQNHVSLKHPYLMSGTNVSIVTYEWERSAFEHYVRDGATLECPPLLDRALALTPWFVLHDDRHRSCHLLPHRSIHSSLQRAF